MPGAHRDGDSRVCGAFTIVEGQSTVFVNGKLWAVVGDPESHEEGRLLLAGASSPGTVTAGGIPVIVHPTTPATGDMLFHPDPPTDTDESSGNVNAY